MPAPSISRSWCKHWRKQWCGSGIYSLGIIVIAACQTSQRPSQANPTSAAIETLDESLELADSAEQGKSKQPGANARYRLGRLDDDDIKDIVYHALESRLNRNESLGQDGDVLTELGDSESFEYSILKMEKDGVELADGRSDDPSDIDVEVHAWYKRTRNTDSEQRPECVSFDTSTRVQRRGDNWVIAPNQDLIPRREQPEDCY